MKKVFKESKEFIKFCKRCKYRAYGLNCTHVKNIFYKSNSNNRLNAKRCSALYCPFHSHSASQGFLPFPEPAQTFYKPIKV